MTTLKANHILASRLHETETKLWKVEDRLESYESRSLHGPNIMIEDQVVEQEVHIQYVMERAKEAKAEQDKLTKRSQVTQQELQRATQTRLEDLQALNNLLQRQLTEAKEGSRKREELEENLKVKEETYADFLRKSK